MASLWLGLWWYYAEYYSKVLRGIIEPTSVNPLTTAWYMQFLRTGVVGDAQAIHFASPSEVKMNTEVFLTAVSIRFMVATRHAMRKTILHLGRVKVFVSFKHERRRCLLLVSLPWHLKTGDSHTGRRILSLGVAGLYGGIIQDFQRTVHDSWNV